MTASARQRALRLIVLVSAALLASVAIAACGDDDDVEEEAAQVEEVALAYGRSDGAEACEFMSASALDQLGGESGCTREFEQVPPAEFDIQEVTIDDDTADASVENVESGQVIDLGFVKEDDEWKISSFPGLDSLGQPPGEVPEDLEELFPEQTLPETAPREETAPRDRTGTDQTETEDETETAP